MEVLDYKTIVDKVGVEFEDKPSRRKFLSELINSGKLEQAKRLASFYQRLDSRKNGEKVIEIAPEQAKTFFEYKEESLAKAEDFLKSIAPKYASLDDYSLESYEGFNPS